MYHYNNNSIVEKFQLPASLPVLVSNQKINIATWVLLIALVVAAMYFLVRYLKDRY